MPSYKMDSVLGKLQYHIAQPVAEAAQSRLARLPEPFTRIPQSVARSALRKGKELKAAVDEHAVRRKAASINAIQSGFERDEQRGMHLLSRSLSLLDNNQPDHSFAAKENRFAEMMEVIRETGDWAPESEAASMFVNPTEDRNITDALRKAAQDLVSGYLFHRNEQLFQRDGKTFDAEKANRQKKGVAAMLLGNHAHMGTGDGKSSTVLPIVALVESCTSEKQDVVLATASDQSLTELRGHLERLAGELSQASLSIERRGQELDKMFDAGEANDVQKEMQREAIINGSYSDGLKQKIRDLYWKEQMKGELSPRRCDMLTPRKKGRRVLLATERDLVFAYEEEPRRFLSNTPTILMDEADIPYRRQTPYVTTSEAQYYSPEEIMDSMGTWLTYFIVKENLNFPSEKGPGDFVPTQGGFKLTEEAQKRLGKLQLQALIDHPGNRTGASRAFEKGVREIAQQLGLTDGEEEKKLERRMRKWVRGNLQLSAKLEKQEEGVQVPEDERLTEKQQVLNAIAERLAGQYYEQGVSFLADDSDGSVQVRDAYIDDLLEGHRHVFLDAVAIRALQGTYRFIPPYRTSGRTIHFQTFAVDVGDCLRCASGSLMFPDLISGKIRKDSFAVFLEEATRRKAILISPPEVKKAPSPRFASTPRETIIRLVEDVSRKEEPRLVICYDRLEGEALFEEFKTKNPDKQVRYMPIHPTAEEVASACRDLAEGKIDVLISAGNLGFGVNIVKANGEFPNLHVAIYGLPENQLQIVQALGRRRKEGGNFSWYIAEPVVHRYIAEFKEETSWDKKVIQGYLSVDQMLAGYEEAKQDPAKALIFTIDLLDQHEKNRLSNDSHVTYFDGTMEKVRRYATGCLASLIDEDITAKEKQLNYRMKEDEILRALAAQAESMSEFYEGFYPATLNPKTKRLERQVAWMKKNREMLISQYGIPDTIDEYASQELTAAHGSFQASNVRQLLENKLAAHLVVPEKRGGLSRIEQYVHEWFSLRKTQMGDMTSVLSDDYRLQRMFPVVIRSAPDDIMQEASKKSGIIVNNNTRRNLEQFLPTLFTPLSAATAVPMGVTLGVINIEGGSVLSMRQGQSLYILRSFKKADNAFAWETGALGNLVGLNVLGSPIGRGGKAEDAVHFIWSSRE